MDYAIEKNDIDYLKILLMKNVTPPNYYLKTYSKTVSLDLVNILSEWENFKQKKIYFAYRDSFEELLKSNRHDIIVFLLSNDFFIQSIDNYNVNLALKKFSSDGNLKLLKLFFYKFNNFNYDTINAMKVACVNGHKDIIEFFLNEGFYNDDLLLYSVESNDLEMVKFIVNHLSFENYYYGFKVLSLACKIGNYDIVNFLIDFFPESKNSINNYEVIDMDYGPDIIVNPLYNACLSGNIEVVKLIIKNGGKPNKNISFFNIIHKCEIPIIDLLIDNNFINIDGLLKNHYHYFSIKLNNYICSKSKQLINVSDYEDWLKEKNPSKKLKTKN